VVATVRRRQLIVVLDASSQPSYFPHHAWYLAALHFPTWNVTARVGLAFRAS
jgi:hypothetical protein